MKTLVISGSIRSRKESSDFIYDLSRESQTLEDFIGEVTAYQKSKPPISNSDILAGAVLMAMKDLGAEIDYFPLVQLFPVSEKKIIEGLNHSMEPQMGSMDTLSLEEHGFSQLQERVSGADGIVLVSPVYFGDRSSVANKFLQLSGIHNFLEDKVFGAVSVGAKRNGGQETTIIYGLYEALYQSALVVGNGPPTSQYGGTAVGGKRGSVEKDLWGIQTSFGTGTRVAHVSEIMETGSRGSLNRPLKVLVLVTMDDNKHILQSFLEKYFDRARESLENVEFRIENILDSTIYRCIGCDTCPFDFTLPPGRQPTKENHPHCIIKHPDDVMEYIHNLMLDADGIIIAGLNVKQHRQLVYRYQVLIERTRYIRRDHFELTNKMMTAFTLNQVGAKINPLHSLKTLTSYIRHNTIFHKPIEAFLFDGKILDDGMSDLIHFVNTAEKITRGINIVNPLVSEYVQKEIGGY